MARSPKSMPPLQCVDKAPIWQYKFPHRSKSARVSKFAIGMCKGRPMETKRLPLNYYRAIILLAAALALVPVSAPSQTSFFQGKTITIIQGRDPGGTGDLRVKALFPYLHKHIPGNPTIVSEYMPGGGSRKAANHIFRTARPDGLTIGNFSSAMVSLAILGE